MRRHSRCRSTCGGSPQIYVTCRWLRRPGIAGVLLIRNLTPETTRRRVESGRRPLSSREKELYQQIHPAKLATDVGVTLPSTYLIWIHQLIPGVLVGFIPAIVASALVTRYGNLEKYAASPLGRYAEKYMTHTMEAVRFVGLFVIWFGAWYRTWWAIGAGLVIVAVAWLRGKLIP